MPLFDARLLAIERLRTLRLERRHGILPEHIWLAGTPCGFAAPTVGIVGTRAPGAAAERLASDLARDLAAAGVCIISGLAKGIDAAAHRGALQAGGITIGVLAGGHEKFYPLQNLDLALRMIAKGGAVLSAHAPDVHPLPRRFLERNGIIAALSDAIVVVEAPARSGSLNTASWAADAGIPVLAVPGEVDRPKAAGCLSLIRDGATLIRHAADVLEAIGLEKAAIREPRSLRTRRGRAAMGGLPEPALRLFEHAVQRTGPPSALEARVISELADCGDLSLEELAAQIDCGVPELLRAVHALTEAQEIERGADDRLYRADVGPMSKQVPTRMT